VTRGSGASTIWGERRFFVPGVVFLGVLGILLALSGAFAGIAGDGQPAALVGIAAVLGGGLAGYPLGIALYIPFGLVWRYVIGDYNHFIPCTDFCQNFLEATTDDPQSLTSVNPFRAQARQGLTDRQAAKRFTGFMYERFAPDAVHIPVRGRWETVHTIGGMVSAVVFGMGLSPLVVLSVQHSTPWWAQNGTRAGTLALAAVATTLLISHFVIIAREAGAIERQWQVWLLDVLRRRPQVLDAAALPADLVDWSLG
jgi:hypothetical protein